MCEAIKGNTLLYGKVTGFVVNVLFRKNMTFNVCSKCKAFVPRSNIICGKCHKGEETISPDGLTPVARATLALMDNTGTLVLDLYGKVAESFLGVPVCPKPKLDQMMYVPLFTFVCAQVQCLGDVGDDLKLLVQRRVLWQRFSLCLRVMSDFRVRVMECLPC